MIFEAREVSFSYPHKPILEDLSFGIKPGSVYCLTGPNGAGKSTLIGLALRDLQADKGAFYLSGKAIKEISRKDYAREVAYVPQLHKRIFAYTVREVISMGRHRFMTGGGLLSSEDKEAVEAVIDQLSLGHLADLPYTLLSGGELKLVLIARALVQESRLVIMDEPTANLDIDRSYRILNLLSEIVKEGGQTVWMVSHDVGVPLYLEDMGCPVDLAVLSHGRIPLQGSPREVVTDARWQGIYGVRSRLLATEWEGRLRHGILHAL